MNRIYLFVVLSILTLSSFSQSSAIPLKTYCFGNPEHNFMNKLSPLFFNKLEEILKKNNIDTSSVKKINYNEIFTKYTTSSYLSTHSYTYIKLYRSKNELTSNEFQNRKFDNENLPNNLILLYSTNGQDIENLSIYILN